MTAKNQSDMKKNCLIEKAKNGLGEKFRTSSQNIKGNKRHSVL